MKQFAIVLAILGVAICASSANSQTIITLASFNATNGAPYDAGLTLSGSTFYGTTANQAAVFSLPVSGGSPTMLASLNGSPFSGLTLDGSTLYGTTNGGGANGYGSVFSVPVSGGTPTVLASFNVTDGWGPDCALTISDATLFGTTQSGGASNYGTVFSVPVSGGSPTVLTSFNGSDGYGPYTGLTLSGSTFYGTTASNLLPNGNGGGHGTVFSLPVTGGSPTVLAWFNGSSGDSPESGLTLSGSTLFGTTHGGGAYGYGTVFSVPVTGGSVTVLASFDGGDGDAPMGGLTLSGTTLYGTTSAGGNLSLNGGRGYGTVFSVPVTGGSPTLLAAFNGTSGIAPQGNLTLSGGTLYGTTEIGGASGNGTVFALNLLLSVWQSTGGGSWTNATNWTSPTSPNAAGVQAVFTSSATTSSTITLDGSQNVGSLTFNNSAAGYTLSAGSGGTLTMNNSGGTGSQILVIAGSHTITAPVEIADGVLTVTELSHGRLAISGNISDDNQAESLTLNGDGSGVLVLSGTNTYGGGTIVEEGTLVVTNSAALPSGGNLVVGTEPESIFAPVEAATRAPDAPTVVPEPSTLALLAFAGIAFLRRNRLSSGLASRSP